MNAANYFCISYLKNDEIVMSEQSFKTRTDLANRTNQTPEGMTGRKEHKTEYAIVAIEIGMIQQVQ